MPNSGGIPDRLSSVHSSLTDSSDSQVTLAPIVAPHNEFSITDQWGSIVTTNNASNDMN